MAVLCILTTTDDQSVLATERCPFAQFLAIGAIDPAKVKFSLNQVASYGVEKRFRSDGYTSPEHEIERLFGGSHSRAM